MAYQLEPADVERALHQDGVRRHRARTRLVQFELVERIVLLCLVILAAVLAVVGIFVRPGGVEAAVAVGAAAVVMSRMLRVYRPGQWPR